MKDSFGKTHPAVLISYFLSVVLLSTLCFHPVLISISLVCGLTYLWVIFGGKKAALWLGISLMFALSIGLINPFLNHQGNTVLFNAFGRPMTLESAAYGALTGAMLATICLWVYILSKTIDSRQATYVFGKHFPTITLMMFITLGLFKRYRQRAGEIFSGRKGFYGEQDSMKTGIKTCDVLLTYALENGVDTADSMCARGYGIATPTRYYDYPFPTRDRVMVAMLASALAVMLWGLSVGACKMFFFPAFYTVAFPMWIIYLAFGILCAYPLIIYVWSEAVWRFTK